MRWLLAGGLIHRVDWSLLKGSGPRRTAPHKLTPMLGVHEHLAADQLF